MENLMESLPREKKWAISFLLRDWAHLWCTRVKINKEETNNSLKPYTLKKTYTMALIFEAKIVKLTRKKKYAR